VTGVQTCCSSDLFIAKVKLAEDVSTTRAYGEKETRGSLMIIKPLWNPAAEGPLK
jgi:hypothetical protein